jgi:two-component system, OmpR family, KDP operon response regulator KdpE
MPDGPATNQAPIAPDVVLVVEDQLPNRALLKATVRRAASSRVREATILEATTLAEARTILEAGPIDLLVLDVRLPDGDGLSLARDLGQADERPRILVLSASVLPSDRTVALDAGADLFMAKPFVPADLVEAMASLLDLGSVLRSAGRPWSLRLGSNAGGRPAAPAPSGSRRAPADPASNPDRERRPDARAS